MDFWKFFHDGLLKDSEGDGDSLQVFCTSGDMDVDGLESGLVYDRRLHLYRTTSTKGILKL